MLSFSDTSLVTEVNQSPISYLRLAIKVSQSPYGMAVAQGVQQAIYQLEG